jgi:hypothetical protein
MTVKFLCAAVAISLGASSVFANDAAVTRCRGIADPAQRLACFDAINTAPAPAAAPKAPLLEAPRMVIPEVPKVTLIEPAGSPTTRVEKPSAALFGLEQQIQRTQVERIDTGIEGRFEGWIAKSQISLANGQVWQVTDGSRATLELVNPKVVIRRGFMGAFYMEFEGTNQSPRVRRIK